MSRIGLKLNFNGIRTLIFFQTHAITSEFAMIRKIDFEDHKKSQTENQQLGGADYL